MDPATQYCKSAVAQSRWCQDLNNNMQMHVKDKMIRLANYGKFGAVVARLPLSPIVGGMTLVASLALRVMNIVEPILGIFVDMGASAYYKDTKPLKNIKNRLVAIPVNLCKNIGYSVLDILKIGMVAAIGGIITPTYAYGLLSDKTPRREQKKVI